MACLYTSVPSQCAPIELQTTDLASTKELLVEHIRQDKLFKIQLLAKLKEYGISFNWEPFGSPEAEKEDEPRILSCHTLSGGHGSSGNPTNNNAENYSSPPLLSPHMPDLSECDGASQISGSIIPAALVCPALTNRDRSFSEDEEKSHRTPLESNDTPLGPVGDVGSPQLHSRVSVQEKYQAKRNLPTVPLVASKFKRVNATNAAAARKMKIQRVKLGLLKDTEEARNHIEKATAGKHGQFRCKLCGHTGARETLVLTHIRMSHIGTDRKYPCVHCTFRFKTRHALNLHNFHRHAFVQNGAQVKEPTTLPNTVIVPEVDMEESRSLETSGNSETGLDLSGAYETFTNGDAGLSYICLTCAEVSLEKADILRHILENHLGEKATSKQPPAIPGSGHSRSSDSSTLKHSPIPRKKYGFTTAQKEAIDSLILNVKSPRPPYVCKICHHSSNRRQQGRRHILNQHRDELDLPGEENAQDESRLEWRTMES